MARKRRVLVTGATGNVGSHLVRQLLATGDSDGIIVRAASRRAEARDRLAQAGTEVVDINFDDLASIRTAIAGSDSLFLLTGYSIDMLLQSKLLLEAATEFGVSQVVHVGALSDRTTNFSPHLWHSYVEAMIKSEGFMYTNLHPNFFMEGILATAKRNNGRLFAFVGAARVSWVAAEDIAAVAATAIRKPEKHAGKTYPLAHEAKTYSEVAELLTEMVGKKFQIVVPPEEKLLPALLSSGMEPVYAAGLAEHIRATAHNELQLAAKTYDNIAGVVGRPAIDWRTFIRRNLDQFNY